MEKIWDVIIIGAGAAGLMTAIKCRDHSLGTLLLDGKEKVGAKILMSGGTRCNVTNLDVSERDFESEHIPAVRNVLRAFPSEKAVEFFKALGVELVLEEGGKFFPSTHSAATVLRALLEKTKACGAELITGKRVCAVWSSGGRPLGRTAPHGRCGAVSFENGFFHVAGNGFRYRSRTVVVTTGGLSHPNTGSDGGGYRIARSFGHRIIPTTPALTPFLSNDPDWKRLAGVSLPCRLTLYSEGKKRASFEGPLLFTHFGFSGPAALNLSRHWIRREKGNAFEVAADFLPHREASDFRRELIETSSSHPSRRVVTFLTSFFPERFAEIFMMKMGISRDMILGQFKREEREKMLKALFRYSLPISGVVGYGKAEVTAGGVNLGEVNPKTLESNIRPGLFFAGEVLDVDGRIGGFNFQWAWSSGVVAAEGVGKIFQKNVLFC